MSFSGKNSPRLINGKDFLFFGWPEFAVAFVSLGCNGFCLNSHLRKVAIISEGVGWLGGCRLLFLDRNPLYSDNLPEITIRNSDRFSEYSPDLSTHSAEMLQPPKYDVLLRLWWQLHSFSFFSFVVFALSFSFFLSFFLVIFCCFFLSFFFLLDFFFRSFSLSCFFCYFFLAVFLFLVRSFLFS